MNPLKLEPEYMTAGKPTAGESFGAALDDALAKLALGPTAQASDKQTNGSAALTAPVKPEHMNGSEPAIAEPSMPSGMFNGFSAYEGESHHKESAHQQIWGFQEPPQKQDTNSDILEGVQIASL